MLQLNSTELKNFRDTLQAFHASDFELGDAQNRRDNDLKVNAASRNKLLDEITELEAGTRKAVNGTVEEAILNRKTRIAVLDADDDDIKAINNEVKKRIQPVLDRCYAIVTDEVVKVFEHVLDDRYDDDSFHNACDVIAQWFIAQGAKGVVASDIEKYIRPLCGVCKNSSRKKFFENKHLKNSVKVKDVEHIFLGVICDDPAISKQLSPYKWVNKLEGKKKKNK